MSRLWAIFFVVLFLALPVGIVVLWLTGPKQPSRPPVAKPTAPAPQADAGDSQKAAQATHEETKSDAADSTKPEAATEFDQLKGNWQRTDGGYVFQIRRVNSAGELDAAYLNPRPIHIAKAQARKDGDAIKMHVEFEDAGYMGSKYDLTYDPKQDVLSGVYFQASMGETFEVSFTRMPEDRE